MLSTFTSPSFSVKIVDNYTYSEGYHNSLTFFLFLFYSRYSIFSFSFRVIFFHFHAYFFPFFSFYYAVAKNFPSYFPCSLLLLISFLFTFHYLLLPLSLFFPPVLRDPGCLSRIPIFSSRIPNPESKRFPDPRSAFASKNLNI
jgi:hypothetical protein